MSGGGGGALNGLVHNLLMQLFTLYKSKIEGSKTSFFDIEATHNDHPSYVKHVLGSIYVFFTLFACWVLKVDSLRGGLAEGNGIFQNSTFSNICPSPMGWVWVIIWS